MRCYRTYPYREEGGGGEAIKCSVRVIFFCFIKETWICAMTRHHAESNIIPLHSLWAKSNNKARSQFE